MTLISLTEWAAREGISDRAAREKASKGLLETARKIGRNWLIDESEINRDNRRKEVRMEKSYTNIYKTIEDGQLSLPFKDMDSSEWKNLTRAELVEEVELRDMWDDIEPEVYASVLAEVGLDYGSFDDPDEMWMAYLKKLAEDYEMD